MHRFVPFATMTKHGATDITEYGVGEIYGIMDRRQFIKVLAALKIFV